MQVKQIFFYLFIYILYIFISISTTFMFKGFVEFKDATITTIQALVFIFVLSLYDKLTKFSEKFHFQVTPGKACRGGWYLHQGDKTCQDMMKTEQGQNEISRYNCRKGMIGMSANNFNFTPDSNSQWENERCIGKQSDNIDDNGIF